MKKTISVLALILMLSVGTVFAATADNLVGWWKLNGDVTDSSSYGNDGTNNGATSLGDSFSFDGNDYIVVADSDSLDITDAITIEARVSASGSSYRAIVTKRSGNFANYALRLNSNKVEFYYSGPAATASSTDWNVWQSTSPLSAGWHTIVVVFSYTGEPAVYVDDSETPESGSWIAVGTGDDSAPNDYDLRIGSAYSGYPQYFIGEMDDIRIWNIALASEEIGMTEEELELFLLDQDSDGVDDSLDLCLDTVDDDTYDPAVPSEDLGTNRWVVDGGVWTTSQDKPKGNGKIQGDFSPDMTFTYGCSCKQILDSMSETLEANFGGHYKYGCSKSILEAWNAGVYYIGPTFVETVEVPGKTSTPSNPVLSLATLEAGKDYILEAYGIYRFGEWGDYGIADVEWAYRNDAYADNPPYDHGWTLGEDTYPSVLGLDLLVDGNNIYWGDFNLLHEYSTTYAGQDAPVEFSIYDSGYGDNSGSLFVDIFEDKWVSLW